MADPEANASVAVDMAAPVEPQENGGKPRKVTASEGTDGHVCAPPLALTRPRLNSDAEARQCDAGLWQAGRCAHPASRSHPANAAHCLVLLLQTLVCLPSTLRRVPARAGAGVGGARTRRSGWASRPPRARLTAPRAPLSHARAGHHRGGVRPGFVPS